MSTATTTQPTLSKRLRVLVVEDEMLLAMSLEDLLADLDCDVVGPVARVAEAVLRADTEVFDGAILDINVAGTEVYPVARILVERGIPFIFISGYDADSLPEEWSGHPLLRKPFQPDDFARAITKAFCLPADG
jgi:CheY-like chemotaxis protein